MAGAEAVAYNLADYGEVVLDHYENPRNVGEIEGADAVATVGNPACGDLMKMSLRIEDGVVAEARFKTFGCAAAIAASSMTTVMIRGMRIEDLEKVTNRAVAEALGGLPSSKMHCSVLAEDAIRESLADFRRRIAAGGSAAKG
jgi:nitrogen fixation protein NifU and related proteins